MKISVAVDENWAIGKDGDQLVYISEDLKRFKALTMGHSVILGRKTLATFPGGRPLKGRDNLILSTNPEFKVENARVFPSVDALLQIDSDELKDAFVIGGESVYRALLPYCDTAYVTKIDHAFPADRYFPDLDADPDWVLDERQPCEILEQDGLTFRYLTYRRR